jgi:hypothetical protein
VTDFADQWKGISDAVNNGTFDPMGANNSYAFTSQQNSIGSDWSTIPNYLSSLPSSFAPSQTSHGAVITSQGGASGSASVAPNGAPTNAQGAPSNAVAGSQPQPASGVQSGSLADYFLRGVIIVLGFIFVAIGLNMFRPGVVPDPRRVLR